MRRMPNIVHYLVGVALFALCYFALPQQLLSDAGRVAVATLALMIYWWVTQPVHIAVTALLPIIINAFFNVIPMEKVLAQYFSPIDVLLLGANILVLVWVKTGLSKRIALGVLKSVGTRVRVHIIVWFAVSTILSAFLPNAVVAAALCPIASAMIGFSMQNSPGLKQDRTLYMIFLAIVWGAGIGGFGTPLGGAMNLAAIEYIEAYAGQEYMYISWTQHMLPYLLVLAAGTCVYLLLLKTDVKSIPGSREYFKHEIEKIGKMTKAQVLALTLFLVAVLLAFLRPLYQNILPGFAPFYAFLLVGMLAFFIKGENNEKLLTWEYAAKNINWGLIILFSGGMAIGKMLVISGATETIAEFLTAQDSQSMLVVALMIIAIGILLSNVSSNTAATAILVPIVFSIAAAKQVDPMPYVYLAAASCNCAFILPTSIRAIPVGYGLDIRFMFKKGLAACVLTFVILAGFAFFQL